ncbi:MAG TPA: serine/threonine-protein phosphatase [Ruminococcus sp.]|nr:serine/threonine-protein phosphatase [Ruminococcus sp.]
MRAYLGCDIGRIREENQDSIRAVDFPDGVLALVCDGMGGMQSGGTASKIAVSEAEAHFCAGYAADMDDAQICELLRASAAAANRSVYEAAVRSRVRGRMGTTLVGAFARDDRCCIVNIGDSRAYLITADGSIRQLTTDHTVVQLLYERGEITAEERQTHPRRNELMRAIGVTCRLLSDTQTVPLGAGDRLLLCSDGLYNMIPEERLAELVCTVPPAQLTEVCIAEANANGGRDNISVILLTP